MFDPAMKQVHVNWLRELDSEIREVVAEKYHGLDIPCQKIKRQMTKNEFWKLMEILEEFHFPLNIFSAEYGLGFGIVVFGRHSEVEEGKQLFVFFSKNVPREVFGHKSFADEKEFRDFLFEFLVRFFVFAPNNIRLLKLIGKEVPKGKVYLDGREL